MREVIVQFARNENDCATVGTFVENANAHDYNLFQIGINLKINIQQEGSCEKKRFHAIVK